MTDFVTMFDPQILFSKDNPFLRTATKTHRLVFKAFDRTARLQLGYVEDLVNMNRKRFNTLYSDESLPNKLNAYQALGTEIGKRTAVWAGDLQEVFIDLQTGLSETALELYLPLAARDSTLTSS